MLADVEIGGYDSRRYALDTTMLVSMGYSDIFVIVCLGAGKITFSISYTTGLGDYYYRFVFLVEGFSSCMSLDLGESGTT